MGLKGSSLGGTVQLGFGAYLPESGDTVSIGGGVFLQSGLLVNAASIPNFPDELTSVLTESWSAIDPQFGTDTINNCATNNGISLMCGVKGKVSRSVDNGATWSLVDVGFGTTIVNGCAIDGDLAVVVGGVGKCSLSLDAGETWTLTDIGASTNNLSCVAVQGQQIVVGYGATALVRISEDAGQAWTQYSTASTVPISIDIADDVIIVSGGSGKVARSINRGVTFTFQIVGSSSHACNGASISGQYVFVSKATNSAGPMVFISGDFGATYTDITSRVAAAGITISATSSRMVGQVIVVTGTAGDVIVSHDNGETWTIYNDIVGATSLGCVDIDGGVAVTGGIGGLAAKGFSVIGFREYTPNLYMRIK